MALKCKKRQRVINYSLPFVSNMRKIYKHHNHGPFITNLTLSVEGS